MGQITIVLEAEDISDGEYVRKPTGKTVFTLKRKLDIRIPGDNRTVYSQGIVFLVGEGSIEGVPEQTKLALDLELDEAIEFLQSIRNG